MSVVSPVIALLSLMFLGWWLHGRGIVTEAAEAGMTQLLFYAFMPAALFVAGLKFRPGQVQGLRYTLIIYGGFLFAMAAAGLLAWLRGFDRRRVGAVFLADVRSNIIYVAMPLVALWLGEDGESAMAAFVALSTPFYNIGPLMAAEVALSGRFDWQGLADGAKRTAVNPVFIAPLLAMGFVFTGTASVIPEWLLTALGIVGQGSTALALVVIGASLDLHGLPRALKGCWPDLAVKLVLLPLFVFACYLVWPLSDKTAMVATVITCAASPAFNCYIIGRSIGLDAEYLSGLLACGTVIGAGTAAVWMVLASAFL